MSDNPVVDDFVSQAFDDILSQGDTAETKKEVEPIVTEEQPADGEQVKTEATQEESFTKVDPNELPEEIKGVYKSLLGDYTRKRQAESNEVKGLRAELAELKSQLTQSPTVEDRGSSPEERIKELARTAIIEEQESVWTAQAKSDYLQIDDRLNELMPEDVYDPYLDEWMQTKLDADLAKHIEEKGQMVTFDYKSRAKELIHEWDERQSSLFKKFLERQKSIAKEQSDKLAKKSPSVSPGKSQKAQGKISLEEAAELAFEE